MKIAGKIIQNNNIFESTEDKFDCMYKKHRIIVYKIEQKEGQNPVFRANVFHSRNREYKINENVQRCSIYDVIVFALNKSKL